MKADSAVLVLYGYPSLLSMIVLGNINTLSYKLLFTSIHAILLRSTALL